MVARSAFALAVVSSLALSACGGSEKKVETAKSTGCPSGMIEVAGKTASATFCLDRTEATVGSFLECVGKARCSSPGEGRECNRDNLATQLHPVNCVDAKQSEAYCAAQGKRLPTEEEWEWAARGGTAGPRDLGPGTCWSGGMPQHGTCPVARRGSEENALGLLDMAGNVAEWTSSGTEDARSVRGGAYASQSPGDLAPAARRVVAPSTRSPAIGLRCAKSL